jgi:hypothetical protein
MERAPVTEIQVKSHWLVIAMTVLQLGFVQQLGKNTYVSR